MSVDANLQVVRGFLEAHNAHDIEAMAELVADDVLIDGGAGPAGAVRGRGAATELWAGLLVAFPDHHFEPIAFTAEADRVFVEIEETGTMRGPLGPNEATGRAFRVQAAFRFGVDPAGRIDTITSYFDMAAVGRQLELAG